MTVKYPALQPFMRADFNHAMMDISQPSSPLAI
jgi:hypothetical protein